MNIAGKIGTSILIMATVGCLNDSLYAMHKAGQPPAGSGQPPPPPQLPVTGGGYSYPSAAGPAPTYDASLGDVKTAQQLLAFLKSQHPRSMEVAQVMEVIKLLTDLNIYGNDLEGIVKELVLKVKSVPEATQAARGAVEGPYSYAAEQVIMELSRHHGQ